MFENLTMQVEWRTPLEKLDQLEKCLNEWLATEEHRWFDPSTSIGFQHIDFQRYLTITIGIPHNGCVSTGSKLNDITEVGNEGLGKTGDFACNAGQHSTPLYNFTVANLVSSVMNHLSLSPIRTRKISLRHP